MKRAHSRHNTYSRRNMSIVPEEGNSPPGADQKRRKKEGPTSSSPIRVSKTKSGHRFGGPISVPREFDGDIEMVDAPPTRGIQTKKNRKSGAGTQNRMPNIHGSRESFDKWRDGRLKKVSPKLKLKASNWTLPTSKSQGNHRHDKSSSLKPSISVSISGGSASPQPRDGLEQTTKKLYMPKNNMTTNPAISRKDLLGNKIHSDSLQVKL